MRGGRPREGKRLAQGHSSVEWRLNSSQFPLGCVFLQELMGSELCLFRRIRPDTIPSMQPGFLLA